MGFCGQHRWELALLLKLCPAMMTGVLASLRLAGAVLLLPQSSEVHTLCLLLCVFSTTPAAPGLMRDQNIGKPGREM